VSNSCQTKHESKQKTIENIRKLPDEQQFVYFWFYNTAIYTQHIYMILAFEMYCYRGILYKMKGRLHW